MRTQKNKANSKAPLLTAIIWIVLAAICIQGYFLLSKPDKDKPRPTAVKAAPKKPVPAKVVKRPVPQPVVSNKPKMAIILDDWGYNRSHCRFLSDFPEPVGVAILPGLTYSREVIECALKSGKEPMLHLPFEPHNAREAFKSEYLMSGSKPDRQVKKDLVRILGEMQGVVGVNNHTGSKGTEDLELMTTVLGELKRRGLFFVDSYTSDKSVVLRAASKAKMKIVRRDVFLDNRNERLAIEKQFAAAARIAKRNGFCLMIGHDRALTLQVISEQVEKYRAQGYEFISIKEYIRQYANSGN